MDAETDDMVSESIMETEREAGHMLVTTSRQHQRSSSGSSTGSSSGSSLWRQGVTVIGEACDANGEATIIREATRLSPTLDQIPLVPDEPVGFASLPDQVYRRSLRNGEVTDLSWGRVTCVTVPCKVK